MEHENSWMWIFCTDKYELQSAASDDNQLEKLMNGEIRHKIGIVPINVAWGGSYLFQKFHCLQQTVYFSKLVSKCWTVS